MTLGLVGHLTFWYHQYSSQFAWRLSLILEKYDEFSINRPFNDGHVFLLPLHGLDITDDHRQLLSCVDGYVLKCENRGLAYSRLNVKLQYVLQN